METVLDQKLKINKVDRKRWLDALKSGQYKQAKDALYDKEVNGYCCLGIYCLVCENQDKEAMYGRAMPISIIAKDTLPEIMKGYTSIDLDLCQNIRVPDNGEDEIEIGSFVIEQLQRMPQRFPNILAHMNDEGATFKQIADVIEKLTEPE